MTGFLRIEQTLYEANSLRRCHLHRLVKIEPAMDRIALTVFLACQNTYLSDHRRIGRRMITLDLNRNGMFRFYNFGDWGVSLARQLWGVNPKSGASFT